MKVLLFFFFLATNIATCQGASHPVVGHHKPGFNCLSWRLTVETNNIRDWAVVPQACVSYVGHCMHDYQYREDAQAVADAAYNYAKSTPLIKDFKNTWIFDLGDTVLSSLPYCAQPDIAFGQTSAKGTASLVFKEKKRNELIAQGYRIIGNVGDQWSDLLGEHAGYRTFKVPNPMYYD